MEHVFLVAIAAVIALIVIVYFLRKGKRKANSRLQALRRKFIEDYTFPSALRSKLTAKHPMLTTSEARQVLEALRQYFLVVLKAKAWEGKPVAMPSRLADDAWHEFILFTREYGDFCERAFGTYLHHTPHTAQTKDAEQQMQRTYDTLKSPNYAWAMLGAVPLLFAVDQAFASHASGASTGAGFVPLTDPSMLAALEAQRRAAAQGDGGSSSSSSSSDDWSGDWDDDSSGSGSDSSSDSSSSDSGSSDSGGSSCGGGCGGGGD